MLNPALTSESLTEREIDSILEECGVKVRPVYFEKTMKKCHYCGARISYCTNKYGGRYLEDPTTKKQHKCQKKPQYKNETERELCTPIILPGGPSWGILEI